MVGILKGGGAASFQEGGGGGGGWWRMPQGHIMSATNDLPIHNAYVCQRRTCIKCIENNKTSLVFLAVW